MRDSGCAPDVIWFRRFCSSVSLGLLSSWASPSRKGEDWSGVDMARWDGSGCICGVYDRDGPYSKIGRPSAVPGVGKQGGGSWWW